MEEKDLYKKDKNEIERITRVMSSALLTKKDDNHKICDHNKLVPATPLLQGPGNKKIHHPLWYFLFAETEDYEVRTYWHCLCLNCGEIVELRNKDFDLDQVIFIQDEINRIRRSNYDYHNLLAVYQECKQNYEKDKIIDVPKVLIKTNQVK